MNDISHKVVYLTLEGANCLFGNESGQKIAGLPVVTTDPTLSGNSIVYGDTYVYPSGERIGGIVGEGSFVEESFADTEKSMEAFREHEKMLFDRFNCKSEFGNVEVILNTPCCKKIPTLEERVKVQNFFREVYQESPISFDEVEELHNKHFGKG